MDRTREGPDTSEARPCACGPGRSAHRGGGCDIFGEDHLVFGSDWPNGDNWAPFETVLRVVREYFDGKGRAAAEKYFWKNSVAAYRWVRRDPSQPQA
ncbi:MAG: amidohydrolase family protein [Acidimicrobiales bacterium]